MIVKDTTPFIRPNFNLAPGQQIGRLLSEVEEASFQGLITTKKDALKFVAERLVKNKEYH